MTGKTPQNRQDGMVLIIALVFLVILTLLGITAMSMSTLEERMASNLQETNRSFQTAELGLKLAFSDPSAFAGTGAGFLVAVTNAGGVGNYGASVTYTSSTIGDTALGDMDISKVSNVGSFTWQFYRVTSTGTTAGNVSTTTGSTYRTIGGLTN